MGVFVGVLFGVAILALLITNLLSLRSRMSRYAKDDRTSDPRVDRQQAGRWVLLGALFIAGLLAVYWLTR